MQKHKGFERTNRIRRILFDVKMRVYSHKEKIRSKAGYVLIYAPDHPRANKNRVFEHILVWETANNMRIPDGYVVHHKNGIKDDNRIENPLLMTNEEHTIHHHVNRKRSNETKQRISAKMKERLQDRHNHPRYKDIPIDELVKMVADGETVTAVCQKYNICKCTYYKKLKERGIKQ